MESRKGKHQLLCPTSLIPPSTWISVSPRPARATLRSRLRNKEEGTEQSLPKAFPLLCQDRAQSWLEEHRGPPAPWLGKQQSAKNPPSSPQIPTEAPAHTRISWREHRVPTQWQVIANGPFWERTHGWGTGLQPNATRAEITGAEQRALSGCWQLNLYGKLFLRQQTQNFRREKPKDIGVSSRERVVNQQSHPLQGFPSPTPSAHTVRSKDMGLVETVQSRAVWVPRW